MLIGMAIDITIMAGAMDGDGDIQAGDGGMLDGEEVGAIVTARPGTTTTGEHGSLGVVGRLNMT